MAFNLITNELYVCNPIGFGRTNDKIYLVDLNTGFTELIGRTGFHPTGHNSLVFDEIGNLYCSIGLPTSIGELIKVDINTGLGTLIGPIGYENLTGMALLPEGISSGGDETTSLPKEYLLNQNYPNPFNPITTINYQIPELSFVTLKVYDMLGNEVALLVNEEKPAGKYRIEFRINNLELSSGIYFYQLQARKFIETKKMVLLK
ncbi:MAG: T9SS type A sorting domain-containing protein [Ignavibacteriaceae bacterium]|nr:T9SS type A sorting domain-containing protein [Ignavibacteriaceae bacterium]